MAQVVVGLSGGVDSAVCAHLMLEQGHDVKAVFMQNWDDQDDPHCQAAQDYASAKSVAAHLNIPLSMVNFSTAYYKHVFAVCLNDYRQGLTPNPDVLCNQEIKFKLFLEHALAQGADYIATGHYAQIKKQHDQTQLFKANASLKDQTYFLCRVPSSALANTLFPLGSFQDKAMIRDLAKRIGLPNHNKKDSTGICFIGKRPFKTFLQGFMLSKPGDIVDEHGQQLGRHDGLMFYTIGQRSGLKLGGMTGCAPTPWYVVAKRLATNELVVAQSANNPRLLSSDLVATNLHWIGQEPELPYACQAKIRYRQQEEACHLSKLAHDQIHVTFERPQRAVTPGQTIAFYANDRCLGGATIAVSEKMHNGPQ